MQTNFSLVQHHKYSLSELEDMMPWEREVYVVMLVDYLISHSSFESVDSCEQLVPRRTHVHRHDIVSRQYYRFFKV